MRVGFCLHWREISFHVSPQGEGRSPWFSVGAMTYRWDYDRVESPHLWLRIRPWVGWSWTWKKPTLEQMAWGIASRVETLERMVAEESIRQMHLMGMLPRFKVSYEVIHGEVIRIVERIEPERGGDDISIERIRSVYPGGVLPIAVVPDPPTPYWWTDRGLAPPSLDWPGGTETRPAPSLVRAPTFHWHDDPFDLGSRQDAEALRVERHRTLAEAHARAEPPLSFCADCPGRFRPQDLFIGKKSGTPLCEGCLDRRVVRGAAKKPAEF